MPDIKIFNCTDETEVMKSQLVLDGLIGISGGRLTVRRKLGSITDELNSESGENNFIGLTYNHPLTELSYIWDNERYDMFEAKSIVIDSYDLLNGDIYE